MILLADSGGTKSHWRLFDSSSDHLAVHISGIHPLFQTADDMERVMRDELLPALGGQQNGIEEVVFYGAACSSEERSAKVLKVLTSCFPQSRVQVNHDLLGAARAVCGKEAGLAAILGTGSNSCRFDGTGIVENVVSLGFILGDEGSGAYLGKRWIRAFFYDEAPKHLAKSFLEQYPVTRESVIAEVYKGSAPNTYLASFCHFLAQHLNDVFVRDCVRDAFRSFLQHHILKYEGARQLSLGCIGSVAFHFREVLQEACQAEDVKLGKVLKEPVEALVEYHRRG